MFHGKMKAVTFSYDDAVTQDQRLIHMFNQYGLKCTFNINYDYLGVARSLIRQGVTVAHCKPQPSEVPGIYAGHEVAGHTLTHAHLPRVTDDEIIRQVEDDLQKLSELVGYEVVGTVFPCGDYDDRVINIMKNHTTAAYARTTECTDSFDPQEDLLRFKANVHHCSWDKLFAMAKEFIEMKPDTPQIFYIWGHAYEFDIDNSWDKMEEFCKLISGHEDIFYGTNKEVLLGEDYTRRECNQDLRYLFIGNSYTYVNKLWDVFAEVARGEGYRLTVDHVTKGGYRLCQMNDPENEKGAIVSEKLKDGAYDVVFLQEQSCAPVSEQESFFEASRSLCERIRAIGARPVFYQTWGRKAGHEILAEFGWTPEGMSRALAESYRAIGEEMKASVSPVGDAFLDVYTNHPEIELYHEDKTHPSAAGTYLAALCHYAKLYRKSPIGVSYRFGVENEEEALILQKAAHKVVFGEIE